MTSNHQTLSKHIVVRHLQSMQSSKCDVWDLSSTQDKKDFIKELEKQMRKGSLSIVVIAGDRS
jgi:hypothetical protein